MRPWTHECKLWLLQCASPLVSVREQAIGGIATTLAAYVSGTPEVEAGLRHALLSDNLGVQILKHMSDNLTRFVGARAVDGAKHVSSGTSAKEVLLGAYAVQAVLALLPAAYVERLNMNFSSRLSKVCAAASLDLSPLKAPLRRDDACATDSAERGLRGRPAARFSAPCALCASPLRWQTDTVLRCRSLFRAIASSRSL